MTAIFWLLDTVLSIYAFFIIVNVILSWLVHFNIINPHQQFVQMVHRFVYQITEPACRQIRRFMPDLGGIDLSPLILLLAVHFVRIFLATSIAPIFGIYHY